MCSCILDIISIHQFCLLRCCVRTKMGALQMLGFLLVVLFICEIYAETFKTTKVTTFKPTRDYCNDSNVTKLCNNAPHIGCNPKGWANGCKNPKFITFDTKLKKMAVHHHNWYREKVATGNGRSNRGAFPKAADMLYVDWDEELAYLAQLNVQQCEMRHDQCRAVDVIGGQNLYFVSSTNVSVKSSIADGIRKWYKEIKDASPTDVDNYSGSGAGGKEINHFGAIAWGHTNRVGCAMAEYIKTIEWNNNSYNLTTHLLACNYAPMGNWLYSKMYTKGEPCSKCPSKVCKKKYKLCKTIWDNPKNKPKRG